MPNHHRQEPADHHQEQRDVQLKLGAWVGNQRSRAASLTPERMEQLSEVGMRWAYREGVGRAEAGASIVSASSAPAHAVTAPRASWCIMRLPGTETRAGCHPAERSHC
ncbi:helicase associated domain-containing protein [Streptomyces scopuliridis]